MHVLSSWMLLLSPSEQHQSKSNTNESLSQSLFESDNTGPYKKHSKHTHTHHTHRNLTVLWPTNTYKKKKFYMRNCLLTYMWYGHLYLLFVTVFHLVLCYNGLMSYGNIQMFQVLLAISSSVWCNQSLIKFLMYFYSWN